MHRVDDSAAVVEHALMISFIAALIRFTPAAKKLMAGSISPEDGIAR